MTRTRMLAAAAVLLCALAGCSSNPEPAAAPTTPAASSAAPSPSASPSPNERISCNTLVDIANDNEFDPNMNQKIGHDLSAATSPGIQAAGNELVIAANDALAEPGPAANIAIAQAQLAVAEACADAFGGDGPW